MKTKQFILIFTAMFLFLCTSPQKAYCQWVDKSDELPGIIDGEVFLIAAGGVIVTGLITYLIVKKSKKEKTSFNSFGDQPGHLMAKASFTESGSFYDKMKVASQKSPIEIFTGTSDSHSPIDYNLPTGLSVGLRFKF